MTEARNAEIVRMWNLDLSASEIAKELKTTRNTVIGVVSRLRPTGVITRKESRTHSENGRMGGAKTHSKYVKVDPVFKIRPRAKTNETQDGPIIGVPIYELEINGCRYPTSTVDETHYFCGDTQKDKSSYCESHHKLCWVKITGQKKPRTAPVARSSSMMQFLRG